MYNKGELNREIEERKLKLNKKCSQNRENYSKKYQAILNKKRNIEDKSDPILTQYTDNKCYNGRNHKHCVNFNKCYNSHCNFCCRNKTKILLTTILCCIILPRIFK